MGQDGVNSWPDIEPPIILLPTDPANVIGLTGFTITCNSFIGSALTQTGTDYEIWTLPQGAGSLLWSAYNDSGLLLKIVPALAVSAGTRYLRCRMRAGAKESAWCKDKVLFVV